MTDTLADTPDYAPVPVPGAGEAPTPEVLAKEIDEWISSAAFTDLAASDGAQPNGTLAERLAYLDGFSAAAWDFRAKEARAKAAAQQGVTGYVERNQVDRDAVSGDRERAVVASARALGLVDARPPRRESYDHVLVLGGLVRANLWRSAYAGHLIRTEKLRAPDVTALTAFRDLAHNEQDPTQDEPHLLEVYSLPQRANEAEVMEDCLERAFTAEPLRTHSDSGDGNADARFRVATGKAGDVTLNLVAAPNPKSQQRADTASTMQYWASEVVHVKPGDSILFITSTIYVPFQHAVAVQNLGLPFGAHVETVGVDHTIIDASPLPQVFRGVNYLQELRSSVRAYRTLLDLVAGPAARGQ